MKHSEQLNELGKALAAAQSKVQNAVKDSENPHFRSKYADLATILDVIRPHYSAHGIAIIQGPYNADNGEIGVRTRLLHSSGQWIESEISAPLSKKDAQGVGSVVTYLRRYGGAAMAGVAQADDDGEGAVDRTPKPPGPKEDNRKTAKKVAEDPLSPQALQDALLAEISAGGSWDAAAVSGLQKRIRALYDLDQKRGKAVYDAARAAGIVE